MTNTSILYLGSGKLKFLESKLETSLFYVFLDRSYSVSDDINVTVQKHKTWMATKLMDNSCVSMDVFDFLETYPYRFDQVNSQRLFEHMFYDSGEIGRLLHLCYQITDEKKGKLTITVPNADILADKLINLRSEKNLATLYDSALMLNTEFCNTRSDPHGSIWTPELAEYYISREGWKIDSLIPNYKIDNRPIYLKLELVKQ